MRNLVYAIIWWTKGVPDYSGRDRSLSSRRQLPTMPRIWLIWFDDSIRLRHPNRPSHLEGDKTKFMKILHHYWLICLNPECDHPTVYLDLIPTVSARSPQSLARCSRNQGLSRCSINKSVSLPWYVKRMVCGHPFHLLNSSQPKSLDTAEQVLDGSRRPRMSWALLRASWLRLCLMTLQEKAKLSP
jgi:hypothetical protein